MTNILKLLSNFSDLELEMLDEDKFVTALLTLKL